MTRLAAVAVVVPDYDEAIAFFTRRLGFELREDTDLGGEKRWVRVGPPGGSTEFLLARAVGERQRAAIGNQGGGRVWLFLETSDFAADYARLRDAGVLFEAPAREEPYGRLAVFRDPWGNRWDLIQYADQKSRRGTGKTRHRGVTVRTGALPPHVVGQVARSPGRARCPAAPSAGAIGQNRNIPKRPSPDRSGQRRTPFRRDAARALGEGHRPGDGRGPMFGFSGKAGHGIA